MEKLDGGGKKRKGKPIRGSSSKGRRKRPVKHSGGKQSADKSTLIQSILISDQLPSPLGEKGPAAKDILCDGGCGPASGCLSPTVSSSQTCLITSEEPMHVTSRAKRLKGATRTGQPSDQHHLSPNTTRIPKTDRRTRSASCHTSTATLELVVTVPLSDDKSAVPELEKLSQESNSTIILNTCTDSNRPSSDRDIEIKPDKRLETTEKEFEQGTFSISLEVEKAETLSGQCQPSLPSETRVKKRSVDRKTAKSKSTNDKGPVCYTNSGNNIDHDCLGLYNNNPPKDSTVPMTVPVTTSSKVINQPYCTSRSDSWPRSDSNHGEVLAEKSGSSVKTNPNKFKNEQKLNLAPMLLMNNLPYMGELTFDTRPRRGRKPKKADICHLISKNYGIHFPLSYTNVPNTGSYPPTGICPKNQSKLVTPPTTVLTSAISKGKVRKNSSKTSTFSTSPQQQQPQQNWTFSPPALLPIHKSLNNPVSTTESPATVTTSKGSSRSAKPYSNKNRLLSSKGTLIRNNELHRPNQSLSSSHSASIETHYSSSGSNNGNCAKQIKGDEPLNLCVRDASLALKNLETDERNNYATIMNLNSFPSQGLFNDFHLRQQAGKRLGQAGLKRGSSCSTNDSNKISKVASEKVIGDSNLVNNLSFQLALANTLHGQSSSQHQMNKSLRKKPSNSQQFEPLETPGGNEGQNRKSRKRPHYKQEDSFNDNPPSLVNSVSSNTFQNSSVHLPMVGTNSSPDNHIRCGLFGQPDLGVNSEAQVSICKFKFTGGAKPSLQEKKMLSVDSGGNFRFFTDKCNNSSGKPLKNCGSSSGQGSSSSFFHSFESNGTGSGEQDCQYAFSALPKSAKSMSVCMPVRTPSVPISIQGSSKQAIDSKALESVRTASSPSFPVSPTTVADLQNLHLDNITQYGGLEIPPPSSALLNYSEEGYSSSDSELSNSGHPSPGGGLCSTSNNSLYPMSVRNKERLKKKRRTRKSLMREKLEKTFKEKGFLIQTQQLESAEGATYCKFRQLRKFTRYLFRSWKDYLPDNVKEINIGVNEGEGSTGVPTSLATIGSGGTGGEIGGSGSGKDTMQLDLTSAAETRTHSGHNQRNNCSRGDDDDDDDDNDDRDNEDCEEGQEEDDEVIDHVTVGSLRGDPDVRSNSLPVINSTSVLSNNNNSTDEDSDASNDVDVENIDGHSDTSSLQYSANIVIKRESNDEDGEDNGDNTPEDLVANE